MQVHAYTCLPRLLHLLSLPSLLYLPSFCLASVLPYGYSYVPTVCCACLLFEPSLPTISIKWLEHVKQITNKANSVYGFLRCNLYSCPMSTKINCYKALVKPVLDYSATVWSPYTQKDIDMVKQVQRRAARFIFNNYSHLASVSEMLTDLN